MRRRKKRYTWLPTEGTALGETTEASSVIVAEVAVSPTPNGDFISGITTVVFPFVEDTPQEDLTRAQATSNEGIGEIVGNDYIVERIVGKVFVGYSGGGAGNGNAAALVSMGIFVARADNSNNREPVGFTDDSMQYSPLVRTNVRLPWMFKRSWMLHDGVTQTGNPFTSASQNARTNYMGYGACMEDGPHVDVRSVRRIRQEERLFMALSAQGVNPRADGSSTTTPGTVDMYADIRVLGALRKARNTSSF